ncbi:DDRGK domain-containing protein 1-like [Tubulanus polymorphus]|uniref:DDRGK domain-containing protein 1-like n=1 Tax=Tubulanus polymorphus TaxID=672921 RepID=UPI003DA574C1
MDTFGIDPMVYAVMALIIVVALFFITKFGKSAIQAAIQEETRGGRRRIRDPAGEGGGDVAPAVAAARRAGGARARQRLRRPQRNVNEEEDMDDEDGEDGPLPYELDIDDTEGKIGAKKLRKIQEKAEKKAMREQVERDREERKKREAEFEKLRKEKEEQEKAEEALREAEEKKRKEEEEKRAHEEYLKMKEAFTVDEEGVDVENLDADPESLLQEFIDYIKQMKVVMLEDLAAHFKIKTQDCIERVQSLQEEGRLTGVIDDRGKFIYITMEELEAVAKFIKQRGRVSITELAESSNKLIDLSPDNEIQKKLMSASESVDVSA